VVSLTPAHTARSSANVRGGDFLSFCSGGPPGGGRARGARGPHADDCMAVGGQRTAAAAAARAAGASQGGGGGGLDGRRRAAAARRRAVAGCVRTGAAHLSAFGLFGPTRGVAGTRQKDAPWSSDTVAAALSSARQSTSFTEQAHIALALPEPTPALDAPTPTPTPTVTLTKGYSPESRPNPNPKTKPLPDPNPEYR